jgi:hypothetical protein
MKKKQKIFAAIALIVIIGIGVFYFGFYNKSEKVAIAACSGISPLIDLKSNQVVKCDSNIDCSQFMSINGASSSDISNFKPTCNNGSCQITVNLLSCQGIQGSSG